MHVRMIQFIKGVWKTGEQRSLLQLAPYFELERVGHGFTIERVFRDERVAMDEHEARARAGSGAGARDRTRRRARRGHPG